MPANGSAPIRKSILIVATAVFLYLCVFVLPATPLLFPFDQFINFDNARRMAAGERLYHTIFQYTFPGTELLELSLIKIFGPKVMLMNAMLLVSGIIDVWLVLILASSILREWDAILAALLFLYFGIHGSLDATHHKFSMMAAYAAAAVLIRRRSQARILISGTLLGLATSFTQTRAIVAVGFAIFLAWENRRKPESERRLLHDELCLLLPFAALTGLACAYILWNGGWERFLRDIIEFPVRHYPFGWGNGWSTAVFDVFLSPQGIAEWVVVKSLVPAAYLVFFFFYWPRPDEKQPPVEAIFLAIFGLSLFATVAFAPAYNRIAEIWAPAIILTLWMLSRIELPGWRIPAWAGVCVLMLVAIVRTQVHSYYFFDGPAGRIAISSPDEFEELTWLSKRTRPGDQFFSAGTPMFYVLLGLHNISQVPFIEADNYTRADQVEATAQSVRTQKPQFIFWPFTEGEADHPSQLLYPLGEELRGSYRPVIAFPDGQVWERKDPIARSDREVGKLPD